MNQDEENQIHPCSKCGKDFDVTVEKGFKFKKSVAKKLRCLECAWGGKEGLDRHVEAEARFQKELLRQFTSVVQHGVGVSPGPNFNVSLTVAQKLGAKRGFYTFSMGAFEGHPVTLTIRIGGPKGEPS